jgi:hypothetical protein
MNLKVPHWVMIALYCAAASATAIAQNEPKYAGLAMAALLAVNTVNTALGMLTGSIKAPSAPPASP